MTESATATAPAAEAAAQPAAAAPRQRLRHVRKNPLSIAPAPLTASPTLYDKALDLLAPWHRHDYPGRYRAWVQLAAQMPWVLHDVRLGKRPYDNATLERLATFAEARAETAAAVAAALRAEAERIKANPKRQHGICRVDPVTGRDKRYRGAKSRKKPK